MRFGILRLQLEQGMSHARFARTPVLAGLAAVLAVVTSGCSPGPDAGPSDAADTTSAARVPARPAMARAPEPGTAPSAKPSAAKPSSAPRLTVDGDGLRWFLQPSGSARPIAFGSPQAGVIASMEAVRGVADRGTNQDCGAGPVEYATWSDGLSLVFQKNRFVGWSLSNRAKDIITTAAGLGPGSTRAELESAYSAAVSTTSLGYEFSAGAIHGVLDGGSASARITDMWAGVSCSAR